MSEATSDRWAVVVGKDKLLHVVPLLDLQGHQNDLECWCKPTADPVDANVIVHHSADHREAAE